MFFIIGVSIFVFRYEVVVLVVVIVIIYVFCVLKVSRWSDDLYVVNLVGLWVEGEWYFCFVW